ncbi:MAG: zinc ABC transporter substrate-binding protein [Burkholderiales bacterium]
MKKFILMCLLILSGSPANAALNILACEPEWSALAIEIGGDKVSVSSATNALQDPHHVEAKPSLIAKARNADLLICTGAELEIGWLPVVLQQSANPKIQPGKAGNFAASEFVEMKELPLRNDRAEGDIHPGGNPHIQTDPRNIIRVAAALVARMKELDGANANFYLNRYDDFAGRWQAALKKWAVDAAPLKGLPIVVQHRAFIYMNDWLGLKEIGALEPKPGVEPTVAHMSELLEQLKRTPAKMVIRAAYQSERPSEFLRDKAKIPAIKLPFTVGGNDQAKDLFGLYENTIQLLLGGAK